MRKLSAALLLFLGLASAALAQFSGVVPVTQASVTFSAITARTTLISGLAGKSIYLTNITAHPASTAVLTLTYGTGTNCGTGTTVFYGPATFQGGENVYNGNGAGAIYVVPSANDVCITISTAAAPGWLSYAQF
jgi:hypothetical protein